MSKDNPTPYQAAVVARTRAIPAGSFMPYGQIADEVGGIARSVGQALLPYDWDNDGVPCHRVVMNNGQLKSHSETWPAIGAGLLRSEGVAIVQVGEDYFVDALYRSPYVSASAPSNRLKPQRALEPCWKHETVQFSCRDCNPTR